MLQAISPFLTKSLFNNIFQDTFNKILSQQLTHDRSYMSNNINVLLQENIDA